MNRWRVFQLVDSAFPSGAFAHSAGLEATLRLGQLESLETMLDAIVWQTGRGALPFVGASFEAPEALPALDRRCDATLLSHVANRASRAQGRALVGTSARVFDVPVLAALDEACRSRRLLVHLAPAFGAVMRALDVSREDALAMHLHAALRGAVSACVRLGLVGPHEGQRMIDARGALLERTLAACATLSPDEAAQAAPLLDLFGMRHDDLEVRMFVS